MNEKNYISQKHVLKLKVSLQSLYSVSRANYLSIFYPLFSHDIGPNTMPETD
jgi:hypothetical protein